MSTRKRILVNGLLAAVPLAVFGAMLGTLAGMFLDAQPGGTNAPSTSGVLAWRVAAALAVGGFLFVAVAEGLLSLWRVPPAPPKPDPNKVAEELIQSILREAEQKEQPQMKAEDHRSERHNLI